MSLRKVLRWAKRLIMYQYTFSHIKSKELCPDVWRIYERFAKSCACPSFCRASPSTSSGRPVLSSLIRSGIISSLVPMALLNFTLFGFTSILVPYRFFMLQKILIYVCASFPLLILLEIVLKLPLEPLHPIPLNGRHFARTFIPSFGLSYIGYPQLNGKGSHSVQSGRPQYQARQSPTFLLRRY